MPSTESKFFDTGEWLTQMEQIRGPPRHSGPKEGLGRPGVLLAWRHCAMLAGARRPYQDRRRLAAAEPAAELGRRCSDLPCRPHPQYEASLLPAQPAAGRIMRSASQWPEERSSTLKIACCTAPLAAASSVAELSRLRAICASCRLVASSCVPSSASRPKVHSTINKAKPCWRGRPHDHGRSSRVAATMSGQ